MIIGYARVSTLDQNLELQRDALEKAGCEQVFEDHVSGSTTERPGWVQAQTALRKGDTLVVWRLDRLGRSLKHLIDTINELGLLTTSSRRSPRFCSASQITSLPC